MKVGFENRLDYIDVMKGLAILYVVIGHVLAWSYSDWHSAVLSSFKGTIIWQLIYSFHMPLFMFLSGYVVFNPSKAYCLKDIFKRLTKYLIPFIFVGIVLFYYREDPSGIFNYWYLRTLAEYVLILWLIEKVFNYVIKSISNINVKYIVEAVLFILIFFILNKIIQKDTIVDLILCKKHLIHCFDNS